MKKIVHVITGLDTGGAEMMLFKLLQTNQNEQFSQSVVSLTDIGTVGRKIKALGISVSALDMRRGIPSLLAFIRLVKSLRIESPDVVQSWMYHADFIAGFAAKFAGGIPVIWGIRNSNLDSEKSKKTTIWLMKLCASLSSTLPTRIVCCSHMAADLHKQYGYAEDKIVIIPNGFDLENYVPSSEARTSVREELGVGMNVPLVGLVGRFDPQKDHQGFIAACARLHQGRPDAHYLLCGTDINWQNKALATWIKQAALEDVVHLLGERDDIPRLSAALDVAVSSSSYGEAFPNVIGEAMACGVPCVVTDVGDSAIIVDDTGEVVTPDDPEWLAASMKRLLDLSADERARLGAAARNRVASNYDLSVISDRYEKLYKDICSECAE